MLSNITYELLQGQANLLYALAAIEKEKNVEDLSNAVARLGESINTIEKNIGGADEKWKNIKESIRECKKVYTENNEIIMKQTLKIIKTGIAKFPVPPIAKKHLNHKGGQKLVDPGNISRCDKCKEAIDIIYVHNEGCKLCKQCILGFIQLWHSFRLISKNADNLGEIKCNCKVLIPEDILFRVDSSIEQKLKGNKSSNQIKYGSCIKCSKNVDPIPLECSHVICKACIIA